MKLATRAWLEVLAKADPDKPITSLEEKTLFRAGMRKAEILLARRVLKEEAING